MYTSNTDEHLHYYLDRWFSAIPGPTQPNRLFVFSGTSHGAVSHVKKQLALGYPQKTIFDSVHENGMDFGIYFQSVPSTLFYRNLRKLKYVFKFHLFNKFKKDAQDGKLPNLTVLEPRYLIICHFWFSFISCLVCAQIFWVLMAVVD